MCTSTPPVSFALPMDTSAAALVRALFAESVCGVHHPQVFRLARLCASELVTNAVLHGTAPVTFEVECDQDAGLLVRVHDHGPLAPLVRRGPPPTLDQVDATALSGRGLALVDLISDAWGIERRRHGKAVWFRVCTPRESLL